MVSKQTTLHRVGAGNTIPDSKVHGANMEPIWGRQAQGGPRVGLMNFAICDVLQIIHVHVFPRPNNKPTNLSESFMPSKSKSDLPGHMDIYYENIPTGANCIAIGIDY